MDAVASAVRSSDVGSWVMLMMALGLVEATGAADVATGEAAATAALGDGAASAALGDAATAGLADAAGATVGGAALGAAAPVVGGEVGATAVGVVQAARTAEATGNPAPTAARRRKSWRRVVRFDSEFISVRVS
jgi:hypothetical protein